MAPSSPRARVTLVAALLGAIALAVGPVAASADTLPSPEPAPVEIAVSGETAAPVDPLETDVPAEPAASADEPAPDAEPVDRAAVSSATTVPADVPTIMPIAADVPITSVSPNPVFAWSTVVVTGTKTAGTAVATHLFSPNLGESRPFACTGAGDAEYVGNAEYVFRTGDPGTTWSCSFKLTETVQQIGETITFYTGEGQPGETLLPSYNPITSVVAADPVGEPTLSITPPNVLQIDWVSVEEGSNYLYSIYNPVTPADFALEVPLVPSVFVSSPTLSISQVMTPGWWVIDIELRYRAQAVGGRTVTVYVPSPPTVDSTIPLPTGQVQFAGTGEPGSSLQIVEALPLAPDSAPALTAADARLTAAALPGNQVCSTTVSTGGTWSCTTGVLAPGERQFLARSNAPLTSSLPVAGSYLAGGTFAPAPIVTTVLAPPAPPAAPPTDPPAVAPAAPAVEPTIEPEPVIDVIEDDEPQPEPAAPVEEPAAQPERGGEGAPGEAPRDDPAAPSSITGSIPTLSQLFANPAALAAGGGFALALMLLVAIPSELLNSTLASGGHRLGRGYLAVQGALARVNDRLTALTRTPVLSAAVLVLVMSVIFGFNDPGYGFDPVSVRLTLSMALSIFIVYCLAALLSGAIMKRLWGIESRLEMLPTALLLAILGVVIARLIDFTPGFLIGLAIGLSIIGTVPAALRARAILLQFGVIFAVGVVAYLAYSALRGIPGFIDTLPGVFLDDTLVAIVAESLTGLLIVLLPLAFFSGRDLWTQSKALWTVSFLVVATAFSVIVLPTTSEEVGSVLDLVPWLIPVVIYAIVVFALWAWLSRNERRAQDAAAEERAKDYVA